MGSKVFVVTKFPVIHLTMHFMHPHGIQRVQRFFTEPYCNLETGECYSSKFSRSAARVGSQLKKQWTLLACTTAFLMFITMGPDVLTPIRRRLPGEAKAKEATGIETAKAKEVTLAWTNGEEALREYNAWEAEEEVLKSHPCCNGKRRRRPHN